VNLRLSPGLSADLVTVPQGTPRLPQEMGGLLVKLGVYDADVRTQDQAVRAWLASNEPTPNLKSSIRFRGRGYLLGDPADAD
jgi:hypothetical protein